MDRMQHEIAQQNLKMCCNNTQHDSICQTYTTLGDTIPVSNPIILKLVKRWCIQSLTMSDFHKLSPKEQGQVRESEVKAAQQD